MPSRKVSGHAAITEPGALGVLLQAIRSDRSLTDSVYYALRILPYVFVRNSELRCAKWDEFNLDVGEWITPASQSLSPCILFIMSKRQCSGIN